MLKVKMRKGESTILAIGEPHLSFGELLPDEEFLILNDTVVPDRVTYDYEVNRLTNTLVRRTTSIPYDDYEAYLRPEEHAQAKINRLESKSFRALRDFALGVTGAIKQLQAIEDEIKGLRVVINKCG